MAKLILKFKDVCYFVKEESEGSADQIIVLLPEARIPIPVQDPDRPELKSLLPHYPYIQPRPLRSGVFPISGLGDLTMIEKDYYWFYGPQVLAGSKKTCLEFSLGASQQPLSLSAGFDNHVVSMESLFGATEQAKVNPDLLGPNPDPDVLHSRFVITNGILKSVDRCQWSTYGDATFRYKSDQGNSPTGSPPEHAAFRVVFEIDIEEGSPLLTARTLGENSVNAYLLNTQEKCVELTVGNSPLEALARLPSQAHSLRDFFIYYQLLKSNPEKRFFPEQIDPQTGKPVPPTSDVVGGTSSCCQCAKSTHP